MTAVHFDANGKGHFWPGFSECGAEKVKLTRQKGKSHLCPLPQNRSLQGEIGGSDED